jgi:hypothetical protein
VAKKDKKKHVNNFDVENEEQLVIPEDEIWTYRIDGLQAPRIVDKSIKMKTKIIIVVVLVIAIGLSIFFSVRAVSNKEFKYAETEGGYELIKYSNVDESKEITVDFVGGDKSKPVTELHEYAFNCDEKIVTINLGKDIRKIDGKSFYSCWNLENVFVDDDNPYYCDIDGVLYDKELTQIIYYPSAHNLALARNAGYKLDFPDNGSITGDEFTFAASILNGCLINGTDPAKLEGWEADMLKKLTDLTGVTDYMEFIKDYNDKIGYYVIPSTVTKIGKLAFAYSDVFSVYIPEGVKEIETMGFFKAEKLRYVYSYKTDAVISGTVYSEAAASLKAYDSLPDGLEAIGSDAFTYDRLITYMFVPASVKSIGHHAFFETCYKEDGNLVGLVEVNVEMQEEAFKDGTKTGEHWVPQYDSGLFKKNVETVYGSSRENKSE